MRYSLSYRDVEELVGERGLAADHTTIWRWVQRYAPELNKRLSVANSPSGNEISSLGNSAEDVKTGLRMSGKLASKAQVTMLQRQT